MAPTPTKKPAVGRALGVRFLRVKEAVVWDKVASHAEVAEAANQQAVFVAAVNEGV